MKLKFERKGIRTALGLIAATIVVLSVLFPIHITSTPGGPDSNTMFTIGSGDYRLIIGNPVNAQDADYTCDGIDDHVQFNQALTDLPSIGGQLFVLAGIVYDWGDGETVTRAIDNVAIIGVGAAVSITCDGGTAIFTAGGDRWLFSNFRTDAGGIATGSTTDWMKLNVWEGTNYTALMTDEIDVEDHSARHENGGADEISVADLSGLLADAQTPLSHTASHQSGGADEIKLDDLATPDDNTDLDASATRHGLLLKLEDTGTKYLRDDGTWQPIGGGGDMLKSTYDNDEDGLIDTAAGGTEWDTSAVDGFPYITAGAWAAILAGILDGNVLTIDQADAVVTEYCRLTDDGIESRSKAETQADLDLEAGVDFPSLTTFEDHSARHENGGADEISVLGLSGLLADGQTPLSHASSHENGGADEISVLGLSGLLADGQTPLSHASSHENGGADEISIAGLDGTPAELTTHMADTSTHGVSGTILGTEDVDDTPVDGETDVPVSSNWAFDHDADADAHQSNVITITFIIDGGGSAITTGEWGHLEIPFACTLTAWTLMADQSGSITIDIWGDTYANFPPTDADTMPGSGDEPSITTAQKNQDTAITDWDDYTITAGDILAFNVDSCTDIERVTLSIKAEKS